MDLGIQGKVAIVTGGSRGIGRETARTLLEAGARMAICARGKDALERACAELQAKTGGEVLAVGADTSVGADVERLVHDTTERFGSVDIFVNNAGTMYSGRFEVLTEEGLQPLRKSMRRRRREADRAALVLTARLAHHVWRVQMRARPRGTPGGIAESTETLMMNRRRSLTDVRVRAEQWRLCLRRLARGRRALPAAGPGRPTGRSARRCCTRSSRPWPSVSA